MHEFSTVKNIIDILLSEAKKNNASEIFSIRVSVGELTMLEKDQIEYWLDLMLKDIDITKNSEIKLYTVKGVIKCRECGYEGTLESTLGLEHLYPVIKCPKCNKNNIEIIKGNKCMVEEMEIEKKSKL